MKIQGETPGANAGTYTLRRGDRAWKLKLTALPYGWPEQSERDLPRPKAPVQFARERGRVLRDENDHAITFLDRQDAKYLAEDARIDQLRLLHAVVHALSGDPSVEFEAKRESFPSVRAWLEAVEPELTEAGISDAEIVLIVNKLREINKGMPERVEAATESFLSETPSDSQPESPTAPDDHNAI